MHFLQIAAFWNNLQWPRVSEHYSFMTRVVEVHTYVTIACACDHRYTTLNRDWKRRHTPSILPITFETSLFLVRDTVSNPY